MEKKSIAKNSFIYSIKTIIGLLFPLISYPYVTRVLSVEIIGQVSFSASIISYFSLLAGMGIYTFAVRSGAKYRKNSKRMNEFSSEVFTLNLITTCGSIILFFLCLKLNTKWHAYALIMLIVSCSIPLATLGVEWIYTIYEEYFYITVRTIFVQVLSILFLLIFVKDDSDIYYYAAYTVFVGVGSNIFNFFRAKKYVKLRIVLNKRMLSYIKPIIVLFASAVATQIYLNSDITILGYMASDKEVGLYNSAVKIYNIAKNVLLSLSTVSMPRLAYLLGNKYEKKYSLQFTKILCVIIFLSIPSALGLSILGNDIMVIFAGKLYVDSGIYLKILSLALPFCVVGSFLASGCLVLLGKEKKILEATLVGAMLNVILNIIFIPIFGSVIAAITTVIAEVVTVSIHVHNIGKIDESKRIYICIIKTLLAAAVMSLVCWMLEQLLHGAYIKACIVVCVGMIIYLCISLIIRNEAFMILINAAYKSKAREII